MHTSIVTAVHWMKDEQDEKACRLITGGVDKALYFMMQTSETDYEREKWIQSNWPIYDIKGKTNVYVAMGKHIHSYNINGELLKEFSFEKATKVTSIALSENETIVAGCGTSSVCLFDTTTGSILQAITVPCISIALIGDYIITGDVEGTLVCWQLKNSQNDTKSHKSLSRQSSLPIPAQKAPIRRDTWAPSALAAANDSKIRRRSAWSHFSTPFKIKTSLDTSAVTIFDEDDEDVPVDETDFEETVKENSSFDFDTNDETVKEADGSTSSSGVGSSSKTDPDDTRKSSTLEDDSLNNSVDDVDALFGLTKDDGDRKLEEIFSPADFGRASLSSNAIRRISGDSQAQGKNFTPSPPIPESLPEEEDQSKVFLERSSQLIKSIEDSNQTAQQKLILLNKICLALSETQSRLLSSL